MIITQRFVKVVAIMLAIGFIIILLLIIFSGSHASILSVSDLQSCAPVDTTDSKLELVHIVMRHGARTPVDTYPNDPYVNDTFYPTGWGHLTNQGKAQLYDVGLWLKQRYQHFLPNYYIPDMLHAQSTASPRALMSLSTVLASMFPPQNTVMDWHKQLNWQPIPIVSEPLAQDSLLLVRTSCPRYAEARQEVLQLGEVVKTLAEYDDLFHNLTLLTGMPIKSAEDINSIYITLQAEQEFGLKLPAWTLDYFPHKMLFLAEQSYIYNAYTTEMQKIKGGPFLLKTFNEMQAKCSGKLLPLRRQMYIYAGHDWTVGNILSALQVWQRQMPQFAVQAIFELHRNTITSQCYVQIFLRNDKNGCAKPLTVPGCTHKCPLDKLMQLLQPVLPTDTYEERCRAKNASFVEPQARRIDQARNFNFN